MRPYATNVERIPSDDRPPRHELGPPPGARLGGRRRRGLHGGHPRRLDLVADAEPPRLRRLPDRATRRGVRFRPRRPSVHGLRRRQRVPAPARASTSTTPFSPIRPPTASAPATAATSTAATNGRWRPTPPARSAPTGRTCWQRIGAEVPRSWPAVLDLARARAGEETARVATPLIPVDTLMCFLLAVRPRRRGTVRRSGTRGQSGGGQARAGDAARTRGRGAPGIHDLEPDPHLRPHEHDRRDRLRAAGVRLFQLRPPRLSPASRPVYRHPARGRRRAAGRHPRRRRAGGLGEHRAPGGGRSPSPALSRVRRSSVASSSGRAANRGTARPGSIRTSTPPQRTSSATR